MRERVQAGELQTALEGALSKFYRKKTRIVTLRRRHSRYSSSFAIENLEVRLAGGKLLKLVFKDSSPASLLDGARTVRPHFLYDPLREIEVYQKILEPERFGTPIFYGAVARPEQARYWLFLERVPGPLLWQVGEIETWQHAARWLAELHSHFAGHASDGSAQGNAGTQRPSFRNIEPRAPVGRSGPKNHPGAAGDRNVRAPIEHLVPVPLLQYDRRLLTLWWSRAEMFLSASAPRAWREQRTMRSFTRLAGRHDRVVDRLVALSDTFIHGEFYPSNVIVRRQGSAVRICPIDWEVAGIGPGLIDLAALTSGAWSADQKRTMIRAYREAATPTRSWPPSLPELWEAVQYCQLHLAIQWLGWAADWAPPRMHAQNWLREAVRLSTALGL